MSKRTMKMFDCNTADRRALAPGLPAAWAVVNNGISKSLSFSPVDYDSLAYWASMGNKLEMWLGGYPNVPTPKLYGARRGTEHLPSRDMIEAPIDDIERLRLLAVDIDNDVAALFGSGGSLPLDLFF